MTDFDPAQLQTQLNDFRKQVVNGDPVTSDQLRSAIQKLWKFRAEKHTTLEAASKKKASAKTKTSEKKASQEAAADALGDLL